MRNHKTKAAPGAKTGAAQMKKLQGKHSDNSTHSQCMRLLEALRHHPVTTIEARRDLDILMPAARVFGLKALGHKINTLWTEECTFSNRKHRIACYVLVREAGNE